MRRSAYLFPVVSLAVLLILATAALANQDQREFDINLEVPAWVLIETDVESFDITLGDLADDKVYSNEGVCFW
ncbi:MAG: hypothetical protein GX030_08995 [Firmicutes bacterium]|nr:hypothetical protein [Bacillota bacterium]